MLKRLFSIITISLVLTGSFFSVYNINYPVYADSNTDEWTQVTTNQQLVEAFKYYCKSRDVTIEGSVADAITSFTTQTFNGIVNFLGIDVNVLQANLKYQTDGNLGTRFLFNTLSIDAYNRIFAQFLQDNELEVGDENVEKVLKSGRWFTDLDGNGCWVYIVTGNPNVSGSISGSTYSSVITEEGSYYLYTFDEIKQFFDQQSSFSRNINLSNSVKLQANFAKRTINSGISYAYYMDSNVNNSKMDILRYYQRANMYTNGNLGIFYHPASSTLFFGRWWGIPNTDTGVYETYAVYKHCNITEGSSENTNITVNSTVINNNVYEGDTIINNEGDIINNYPDNPDNPDTPDPPTIPDSGGWQDFSLPDMPNDWLIYGMEKKFPFDIPFNILFALSLLNHEPEIPKFEGDIDLQVCTWHYDIDLTPFDDIATILRKFEVLAFIIGLAILTKNLINWG